MHRLSGVSIFIDNKKNQQCDLANQSCLKTSPCSKACIEMQISHLDVMLDLRQKLHARYIYQFLFLFFLSINIYFLPFLFCFLVLNTVSAPKSRPRPPVIKGVRRRRPPGRDTSTPTEVICINVTNTRRSSPTPSGRRLRRTLRRASATPGMLALALPPCSAKRRSGTLI